MRILFLTPWYPNKSNPNHGVFVRDQVNVIANNHKVCVVAARIDYTSKAFSSFRMELVEHGNVTEYSIVVKQSWPIFNQLNFFFLIVRSTMKICRSFKPQLIHTNISYPGAVWGYLISTLKGVPFIVTEHTRITNNFRSWLHKRLSIYALNRAASIIVVSRNPAKEIARYVRNRHVEIVPNIVNFKRFDAVNEAPADQIFHIGFLGGLDTPVKGLDILLQAASMLKFPFRIHIGGRGSLLNEYQQLAIDAGIDTSCVFYGFINYDDVPVFMNRINLFVSASRYETFGIAIVEALACGRPIVVTDCGGPADFVRPENGVLVPVEDAQKMAAAIQFVYHNRDKYKSDDIRADIRQRYSAEAFTERIEKIYHSAIIDAHSMG